MSSEDWVDFSVTFEYSCSSGVGNSPHQVTTVIRRCRSAVNALSIAKRIVPDNWTSVKLERK